MFKNKHLFLWYTNILRQPVWDHGRVNIFKQPIVDEPSKSLDLKTDDMQRAKLSDKAIYLTVLHLIEPLKMNDR